MADKQSREGKVIGGRRKCGKTTELIKKASKEGLYILCPNRNMARIIFKQAKDMGLNIPHPITVEDLPLRSVHIDKVLIDEVEIVLQKLIGKRVAVMSTSMPMKELENIETQNEIITYAMYQCLVCNHQEKLKGKRKDYSKVTVCPECNGAFVDRFYIHNYKTKDKPVIQGVDLGKEGSDFSALTVKVDIDCSDAIKGLKAVQREARKATQAVKELEAQQGMIDIKNAKHPLSINEVRRSLGIEPKGTSQNFKCIQCGENELTLKSLGVNIKGVKLVCEDCGARQ